MKTTLIRTITTRSLPVFFIAALAGCQQEQETVADAGEVIETTPVDLVITNANIITVDEAFSIQDTVVVNDGRIVEVGAAAIAEKYEAAELVNLQGKTLMPGFIDSHTHIRGRPERYIELSEVGSIAEMQRLLRIKADELGPAEWITGYGWSEDELAEGRRPLRQDLDVVPNNPVTFTRAGGHSAVVSTLALELAEITNQAILDLGGRLDAYQRMFNEDVDPDLIKRRVESAEIMNEQTGNRYEDQAMMRNSELLMMLILMESQVH